MTKDKNENLGAYTTILPETSVEKRIINDPEWQKGAEWGFQRRGHPEGKVINHIRQVLKNIDGFEVSPEERQNLRIIALLHDSFKYRVDRNNKERRGNMHGDYARMFAEKYITDECVLLVIELHDKAHGAYKIGKRYNNWLLAEKVARELIATLGDVLGLYLKFFDCDNRTGTKKQDDYQWFSELCGTDHSEVI